MLKRTVACVGMSLGLCACGGSTPPASTADEAVPPAADTTAAPAADEAAPPTAAPAEEGAAAEHAADADADAEPAPLEVRYHVSPEGLRITVSGIEFVPKATAVRVGNGWGVKLDVEARAQDGETHALFSPEQGPLAFHASVTRGGAKEQLGDQRKGDGEQYVTDDPLTFSRTWPGDMAIKPLAAGDQLELQVGLWGVGKTVARHRPLKAFCTVRMVGGAKPQPVLSPPGTAQ